jgi:hypothetical protein
MSLADPADAPKMSTPAEISPPDAFPKRRRRIPRTFFGVGVGIPPVSPASDLACCGPSLPLFPPPPFFPSFLPPPFMLFYVILCYFIFLNFLGVGGCRPGVGYAQGGRRRRFSRPSASGSDLTVTSGPVPVYRLRCWCQIYCWRRVKSVGRPLGAAAARSDEVFSAFTLVCIIIGLELLFRVVLTRLRPILFSSGSKNNKNIFLTKVTPKIHQTTPDYRIYSRFFTRLPLRTGDGEVGGVPRWRRRGSVAGSAARSLRQ